MAPTAMSTDHRLRRLNLRSIALSGFSSPSPPNPLSRRPHQLRRPLALALGGSLHDDESNAPGADPPRPGLPPSGVGNSERSTSSTYLTSAGKAFMIPRATSMHGALAWYARCANNRASTLVGLAPSRYGPPVDASLAASDAYASLKPSLTRSSFDSTATAPASCVLRHIQGRTCDSGAGKAAPYAGLVCFANRSLSIHWYHAVVVASLCSTRATYAASWARSSGPRWASTSRTLRLRCSTMRCLARAPVGSLLVSPGTAPPTTSRFWSSAGSAPDGEA